jgi:hypothetical protein
MDTFHQKKRYLSLAYFTMLSPREKIVSKAKVIVHGQAKLKRK